MTPSSRFPIKYPELYRSTCWHRCHLPEFAIAFFFLKTARYLLRFLGSNLNAFSIAASSMTNAFPITYIALSS